MNIEPKNRVAVALDLPTRAEARVAVECLAGEVGWFKVGKQLFTAVGPQIIADIKERGGKVFLDMKFHDIPATVAKAIRAGAASGADLMNVHALGGKKMMVAAAEALRGEYDDATRPRVIAVTALTSMTQSDFSEVGIDATPMVLAGHLARVAHEAGMDGVVASPQEAPLLRGLFGSDFLLVTPGIRPAGASADDQARVTTPADAIANGSDILVVGRPIMQAADPAAAARAIVEQIAAAS